MRRATYLLVSALGATALRKLADIATPYVNPQIAAGQRIQQAATNAPEALDTLRASSYEPDLVPGSKRDQMRESLERHGITVAHQASHRFPQ